MGAARGRSPRTFVHAVPDLQLQVGLATLGRRAFLRSAALAAGAAAFAGVAAPPPRPLLKPPRLRRGDLVGLVALGGAMTDEQIERSVRNLEAFGMRVKPGANLGLRRGNYAGQPFQQVQDLHAMFLDREVKAVWSGRGGSGCSELLPLIDYELVRRNAKILVGFSDLTALLLAILRHSGIVTFHGPSAFITFSEYTAQHLRAVLQEGGPTTVLEGAAENARRGESRPEYRRNTIREGTASGVLVGGNLAIVSSLVGTPYAAPMKGAIVFLEDINENTYRVARMLTQLRQGGGLGRAAGVAVGVIRRSEVPAGEAALSLEETLQDHLEPLGIPVASGFSFGHITDQFTLPVGVRARLDTRAHTLTLLEPAVSG